MQTTPVAPMPRRWRRTWIWVGGFVLLVIAAPFSLSYIGDWLLDRELAQIQRELDAEDPNWRWEDIIANQPAPRADTENAAVQLFIVHGLLAKTPYARPAKMPSQVKRFANARLSDEDVTQLHTAFGKMKPDVLNQARKLKDIPTGQIRIEAAAGIPAHKFQGPNFLHVLEVIRFLEGDALLKAEEQKFESAAESCLAILNAANLIGDYSTLMAQLVRVGGHSIGANTLERVLGQGEVPEKNLAALQTALERQVAHNGMYPAFRGERAFTHDFHARLRSRETTISEVMGSASPGFRERALDLFPGLALRHSADELRLMNEMVRALKLQGRQRLDAIAEIRKKADKITNPLTGVSTLYFLVGQVESNFSDEILIQCTAVAVAVERYRVQHRRWPANLDELKKAGFVKEILRDPYDDQPLRYRVTGAGAIVYSIGPDLFDDGSKLARDRTEVAKGDIGIVLWDTPRRGLAPVVVDSSPRPR